MLPGVPIAPDESALLVPVPAAEAAVGEHRAKLDRSAREGVPAHIPVLYPFLPVGELTDGVLESVRVLMAGIEAFDFTLDRVSWFGSDVVWLGPRDPAPFRSLTEKAFAAFPACPPYGGQYADVVPHLTVGDLGGEDVLRLAAAEVSGHLPIATQATEVILMTGPRPGSGPDPAARPGRWRTMATFRLGQAGHLQGSADART
jgi:2'-5' RNA ligase